MLNPHETSLLLQLQDGEWRTQVQLHTSRKTLNKLVRLGLLEERISNPVPYRVERNKTYRIKV